MRSNRRPDSIYSAMTLSDIGQVILKDWETINEHAHSYLHFMMRAETFNLEYETVYHLRYFIANASGWRGPVARSVKAELRRRIEERDKRTLH